ncbi:putative membrane protein [Bacillus sp. OAE603]
MVLIILIIWLSAILFFILFIKMLKNIIAKKENKLLENINAVLFSIIFLMLLWACLGGIEY